MYETSPAPDSRIFTAASGYRNDSARITVLLGRYYSNAQLLEQQGALNYVKENGIRYLEGYTWDTVRRTREDIRTTRLIDALNKGRKWARARLVEQLAPMLEEEIALVVVPSHDPWATETPIRALARDLAASGERIDATACLVRHTKIHRIVYGGPSNRALHRSTIRVESPELIANRRVLLLDDIARSGQSLMACRSLLYEAGAIWVQSAALGRTGE